MKKQVVNERRSFILDELHLMQRESQMPRSKRLSQLLLASLIFAALTFVSNLFAAEVQSVKMVMIYSITEKASGRVITSGVRIAKDEAECLDFSIEEIVRFQKSPNRGDLRLQTSCNLFLPEKES